MSETENPPKDPIRYKFFCKICGTPFRAGKKHAMTCSPSCRVALSNIMKKNHDDGATDLTPAERKLALKKVAHAKGEFVDIKEGEDRGIVRRIVTPSTDEQKKAAGKGVKIVDDASRQVEPEASTPPAPEAAVDEVKTKKEKYQARKAKLKKD